MGRPERPLDPAGGTLQLFASRLRLIRDEAGRPTYRAMAAMTSYSAAALSRAAAGERFPTLEVTLAFARACGGDEPVWRLRWQQARDELTSPRAEAADPPQTGSSRDSSRAPRRGWLTGLAAGLRRNRLLALVAIAVAGVLINLGFAMHAAYHSGQPRSPAGPLAIYAGLNPADGAAPYISRCGVDQIRIERRAWPIYWTDGKLYGHLMLLHSAECHANWGYVYGPNSPKWTVAITTRRLRADLATAPSSFRGDAPPDSWGNLLSDRTGCVRAEAYVITASGRGPRP